MSFKARQIPFPLLWDRMPIDISSAFGPVEPAGSRGFVKAKGEKFILSDTGEEIRFWGTNFNSGACFPERSHAEKVARRLRSAGLNMARFHQMDAEWASPNIFKFSQGGIGGGTRQFDPESIDRLDYFFYCLKQNGIYLYMDFLTYRKFKPEDGVPNTHLLRQTARPYSNFDRQLIELQKEFMKNFLDHVNPYTGLAYKDDPAVAMAEICNENDIFHRWKAEYDTEPWHSRLVAMYEAYAAERGEEIKSYDFYKRDRLANEFFIKVQKDYYTEMYDYLRSIGCKFPITGTNWYGEKEVAYCMRDMDFTDAHTYLWLGDRTAVKNMPHIKEDKSIAKNLSMNCLPEKPFVCSEWDVVWPNEWRADTPVWFSALGCLQGWNGFVIHTYRYDTFEEESITKRLGADCAIGGSYARRSFVTFNDPAKFGLFPHAALIMRRGDVKRAENTIEIPISFDEMCDAEWMLHEQIPTSFVETSSVRMGYEKPGTPQPIHTEKERKSDTGEICRNVEKGIGTIDTDRTKAVYGFIGGETLKLDGLEIAADNDFATIALSSLTDDAICQSPNMLLTAVGRAENTDETYNEDHTAIIKDGHAPILIDVIEADVKIRTENDRLTVWAVNYRGQLMGIVASEYKDGMLSFRIGGEFPSMYYLIQEQ